MWKTWPAAGVVIAACLMVSCSSYDRIPCSQDSECAHGFCIQGFCVNVLDGADIPKDGLDQGQADTFEAETVPDAIETSEIDVVDAADFGPEDVIEAIEATDLPDSEEADEGLDGELTSDTPDISDPGGDVPSTLGLACIDQSDCNDGTCVDWAGGLKICSGPCAEGGCPDGMRCVPTAQQGGSYLFECMPFPNGLCTPCETAGDCPLEDAECLAMTGGEAFCSAPCEGSVCPEGFQCINVAPGIPMQCVPLVGTCVCRPASMGCDAGDTCPAGLECATLGPPESHPDHPPIVAQGCNPSKGTCACVSEVYEQTFTCAVEQGEHKCTGEMVCTVGGGWSKCPVPLPGPELCDGKDNDCSGETDETFTVTEWDGTTKGIGDSCGTGTCAGGTVVCDTDTSAMCSSDVFKLLEDLCGDGLDNDCDGKTDEGCYSEDLDGDGDPNDQDCDPYDAAKHHPTPTNPVDEPCCPPSVPAQSQLAVCDMDCNGQVQACDPDDKDFDGYIAVASGGDDCNVFNPAIHPGAPEKCSDGIDQDCVGGDLSCIDLVDDDKDGFPVAFDCNDDNKNIYPGAPEYCDYTDDDCDGVIDNGNPGDGNVEGGATCGLNVGECTPGIWVCSHYPSGVKMECIGGIGKSEEICDGRDNNCDGLTDEPFVDKGKPCDGVDLDQCKNGQWECSADGTELVCSKETLTDITELCGDGKDNDCDNVIDNGCYPTDMDGDGYAPPQDCDDTRSEFHPMAQEPCCDPDLTGEAAILACDRNCDGQVNPCSPNDKDRDGQLPVANGGYDCDDNNPEIYLGAPEKCGDGIDQDCSGQDIPCNQVTDDDGDGYSPPVDCNDSNPNIHPLADELCNNKDDDCDGVTDNGNPEGNYEPCGSSEGECKPGITQCVHYTYNARVECVPVQGPTKDLCDGLDNNCNGETDEFFKDLFKPCDGPDLDQCKNGSYECSADGTELVCDFELIENVVETCDGLDNDCDGLTDEGFKLGDAAVGEPCIAEGECGPGVVECHPVEKIAICSSGPDGSESKAKPETCDLKDNDCDGKTDDEMLYGGLGIGSVCKGIGACGNGIVECDLGTGEATCSTNPNGSNPQDAPEVCNGLDDDCNGHTDDGDDLGPDDCLDQGVCAYAIIPAVCAMGGWQCDYSTIPDFEDGEELLCDGLDNNCDGSTDENYPVGLACDGTDSDLCPNGTYTCTDDKHGWECVNESVKDIKESCNNKDDDCDAETDEDFPVGEPCDGDDDDLCPNGKWTCTADGAGVECLNETVENIVETCNGIDDDCDGETDEGFGVGDLCDGDDPDQCKTGAFVCNAAGDGVVCEGDTGQGTAEVCDYEDNNCDGTTDEGFDYQGIAVGEPCTGIGECGDGSVVCLDSKDGATCSTNPDGTTPQNTAEICDGKDNDCNGQTDEGMQYGGEALGGPCTGPGECGAGTVVCSPTEFVATCSTAPNGTDPQNVDETCDGKDNDCNGLTDDIDVPDKSSCKLVGVCNEQNVQAACTDGNWVCDYSMVPDYEALEASCDGKDNDCDGDTDDPFPVDAACDGDDTDLCPNGTWTCTPAGDGVECVNEVVKDIVEQCGDDTDNDCDGLTDEEDAQGCVSYYKDQDQDTYGVEGDTRCLCAAGDEPFYTATVAGDCLDTDPSINPGAPEACNDIDDNCNDLTDEDFTAKGDPCDGDDPDQCANGNLTCKADGTGLECTNDIPKEELCNGLDDDCNGVTDDPFPVGQACDGNDSDQCKHGTWTCKADETGVECTNETVTDIQELCNGADDDCDGAIDNGFFVGEPCDGPDSDQCKYGTWTCKADMSDSECVNESVTNILEVCDNKDNDCNGSTDELWPTKGQKCNANPDEDVAYPSPPGGSGPCYLGVWLCKPDKLGVQCVGDQDCAYNATCVGSGSEYLTDDCLCDGSICTVDIATTCSPSGDCLCGSGPACQPPQQCINNNCVTP